MVFDVTLLIGQNGTLEYNDNGEIQEKSLGSSFSYQVPDDRVGKFTIIKDPMVNHINLYSLELYDLPMDIIAAFKSNVVSAIILRLGNQITNGLKNFNLHKFYIKPITVLEHGLQDKVLNDIIVKGISLTANAVVLDSAFGAELEEVRDYESSVTINTPSANTKVDYSTVAKSAPPSNAPVSVKNLNPGNIINTHINWEGEATSPSNKFEQFQTAELGFRALAKNILAKMEKGKTTLNDIISVWAPPSDGNDTSGYIEFMCKQTGLGPNDPIPIDQIPNIAKAISWMEGDNQTAYYTDEMINRGMAMAGINSTVSIQMNDLKIKKGIIDASGTNNNKPINVFTFIKGSTLMDTILNRMKEKYKIEIDSNSMSTMVRSPFVYKNISLPGITTIELLKKIHKDYPSYYMEVPWILDDMRKTIDVSKLGKTWYIEIGLLSVNSLPTRSIWDEAYPNNKTALYSMMNINGSRLFYNETRDRIDTKNYIFKDLTTGIETIFRGKASLEVASIPESNTSTKNSESISKIKINTAQNIQVEASYDAVEFGKRLKIFKNHVYANPEIIRSTIKSDDPNFIEFGYAYTFNGKQLNKVTPLKIKMEFENKNNQFQLVYEVDFYKGIDITQD